MFFYVFFYNIIKFNHFLYRFIIFLYLSSSFSLTRPLLAPYAYVSIELNDCILLSSFALNAILLISSGKTLHLSLLNLFCVFHNDLLFLMIFLSVFKDYLCWFYFFLDNLFYHKVEMLLNSFYNFQIYTFFYDTLFRAFGFFILLSSIK